MTDDETSISPHGGIVVRQVLIPPSTKSEDIEYFGQLIEPGDHVLQIGDQPIFSFTDVGLSHRQFRKQLRNTLSADTDPLEIDYDGSLGSQVEIEGQGRAVKVKFWRAGWQSPRESWILLKPLPVHDVLLSITWFLLHLVIFCVASVSFWYRPHDAATRLFYIVSLCTMGAFVGGFHWWVISGELGFIIPFAVSAILLPAVSLHFFLSFPTAKSFLNRRGGVVQALIYTVPALTVAVITFLIVFANQYSASQEHVQIERFALECLRTLIYGYLVVAIVYYLLSIAAVTHSWLTPRNPIELKQVQWILLAAVLSLLPLSYTMYIAYTDRTGFAFGRIRWPMFLTSVSFMIAYTVGIVRYRMMLLDQIINRGFFYYFIGFASTVVLSTAMGIGACLLLSFSESLRIHLIPITAMIILATFAGLWTRDRFTKWIEQRFYGEKYRLDHALNQMNLAVGELLDRQLLADRMLGSCREVLRIEGATLFLRDAGSEEFLKISSQGNSNPPQQFRAEESLIQELSLGVCFQRMPSSSATRNSLVQNTLRELDAHLVHAIGAEHEVIGIVALGTKQDGSSFTAEDVAFLHALGQITSVALQCANVRNEVRRLNEEIDLKASLIDEQKRQIAALRLQLSQGTAEKRDAPKSENTIHRDAIIGNSLPISRVLQTVQKVARSDSSVLIRGESGTGKELLAQAIHQNSTRADGPLVSVHCAALSPTLLESELFGHAKGAFTGANKSRAGRFELANGGTLFLDEIGDISADTQVKLLRVLQEKRFEPVGSTQSIEVDVRILTATHQNLERLIEQGKFRDDLYYRLNVISIELPPLRERVDDVYELIWHFLNQTCQKSGVPLPEIGDDALLLLRHYNWPGNIRELRNTIERAVVLADGGVITEQHLPPEIANSRNQKPKPKVTANHSSQTRRLSEQPKTDDAPRIFQPKNELEEWQSLEMALNECGGNKAEAARRLGIPRSTFYSKYKKLSVLFANETA